MPADIRAGRAFVEILARDKLSGMLPRILNSAAGTLRAYSNTFAVAGGAMIGGAAGIVTPLLAATTVFGAAGDALDKMSARTGVSAEALSELNFAAERSGATAENVEKAFFGLSRSYYEASRGSRAAQDAFAELGLSAQQLQGMTQDQQLEAVADGLARMTDAAQRGAVAQSILGKSGRQLLPMMTAGAAGVRELREEARRLGLTVSTETARKAAALTDAVGDLKSVAKDTVFEIGSGLAPVITTVAKALRDGLVPINAFIERHQDLLIVAVPAALAIGGIGLALLTIAGILRLGAFALTTFTGTAARLGGIGSFLARPFTAGLAAAQRFGTGLATATMAGVRTAAAHVASIPARVGRAAIAGAAAGARIGAGIVSGLVRIGPTIRTVTSPAAWVRLGSSAAQSAIRAATNWRATAARIRASIGSAVSHGIGRFTALGAAGARAAMRGAGRGIGAGIGGAMGAVGGIAMLGAMLPGMAGGIATTVSGVAMLAPLLLGLLNPATLLIGLLAGGVYAWTRWSGSGRNALQSVLGFFAPLLETAKATWGGVVDAFKAGNLALAGQIALAGLKVVFLQGLQQITALFPAALGPLGEWLAKMGSQLAGGRWSELGATAMAGLRAAFDAGVAGLRMLWGNLTAGMVRALSAAARAIADVWSGTVAGIASSILELASSNSAMGKLLAPVLGVDMHAERQRAETMEPQRRANMTQALTANIDTARRGLAGQATEQELAGMNVHAGMSPDEVREHLQRALRTWEGELAALGGPMPDFLAGARDSVDQSLAQANQRIDEALNAWTDTAEAQAAETATAARTDLAAAMDALAGTAAGGTDDLTNTMADAQRQLQEGLAQASAERAAAEAKAKAGQDAGADDLDGRSFATFSSVALAQQIGGGNTAAEQLAEQRKSRELLARANELQLEFQRTMRHRPILTFGA